jgi:hypothetical protein
MIILDEVKAAYKSAKHMVTNEFARGIIASDARFVNLVNEVGRETIKTNHITCKEVKNDLFTD